MRRTIPWVTAAFAAYTCGALMLPAGGSAQTATVTRILTLKNNCSQAIYPGITSGALQGSISCATTPLPSRHAALQPH